VEPEKLLLPPDEFAAIDEALVHLTRNAVDHGIEPAEVRAEAGKDAIGHVRMTYAARQGRKAITIMDDGGGIDCNMVAAKAKEKGIISEEQYNTMSDQEKMNLIFFPGFTTAKTVTDISGRGFGLDIVKKSLDAVGAALTIGTRLGQGTEFTIAIPDPGQPRK
jgi:two-component system chemotaxis sensor kinase CheA